MQMLARLRYLLAEGFEVAHISGEDVRDRDDGKGRGRLTFVVIDEAGKRRLISEEFAVSREEATLCGRLFLRSLRG